MISPPPSRAAPPILARVKATYSNERARAFLDRNNDGSVMDDIGGMIGKDFKC